jgi:hypothetical protein
METGMKDLHPAIWWVPIGLLVLAAFPMPYGYYTVLRIIVTICAALIAHGAYKSSGNITPNALLFCVIAILFNPLIPIYFSKAFWIPVDVISSAIFFLDYRKRR